MIGNPTSHSCPERGEVSFWFNISDRIRESVPKFICGLQGRTYPLALAGVRGSEWTHVADTGGSANARQFPNARVGPRLEMTAHMSTSYIRTDLTSHVDDRHDRHDRDPSVHRNLGILHRRRFRRSSFRVRRSREAASQIRLQDRPDHVRVVGE